MKFLILFFDIFKKRKMLIFSLAFSSISNYAVSQDHCETVTHLDNTVNLCPGSTLINFYRENFNNGLNNSLWRYGYPWGAKMTSASKFIHENENVSVEDGVLKIKTKYKPDTYCLGGWDQNGNWDPCFMTEYFEYTSGAIHSKFKFKAWGYFETEIKIPDMVNPTWPAVWFYSSCHRELDIIEIWKDESGQSSNNANKTARFTSHGNFLNYCHLEGCSYGLKLLQSIDFTAGFNTFSVNWYPMYVDWFINGSYKFSNYRFYSMSGQYLTNCQGFSYGNYRHQAYFPRLEPEPYDFIINSGVRNYIASSPFDDLDAEPIFEINSVTFKKWVNCSDVMLIEGEYLDDDSFIYGNTIVVKENDNSEYMKVNSNSPYVFRASTSITIENIEISAGAFCDFEIIDCNVSENLIHSESYSEIFGEDLEEKRIEIYPNPFCDKITISNTDKMYKFELINMLGQVVCQTFFNQEKNIEESVNIPGYISNGIYFMKIYSEANPDLLIKVNKNCNN
jgi:beta-glucanase (GH16 family)